MTEASPVDGITAANGPVRLAGSLWRPDVDPAVAALVMIPGSGAADRDNDVLFPPIRDHLLARGIAVASFDKRGVGASSGDWRTVGIEALAGDAAAELEILRRAADVPTSRVGLFGHSQGGWVAVAAAAADPSTGFVVTNSGPWVPVAAQIRFDASNALRGQGAGDVDDAALELLDEVIGRAATGAAWADVAELRSTDRNASRRLERAGFSWPSPTEWVGWQRLVRFDPTDDIERIACPVLALFGAQDRVVPVDASLAVARSRLASSGRLTTVVFAGADHRIRVGAAARFAPSYLSTLSDWVLQVVAGQT